MNSLLAQLFGCVLILMSCSTIENTYRYSQPSSWSSSNPLSVPYDLRFDQFERGNIAPNPSFEEGQRKIDGPDNTFTLSGWETVGNNIWWVVRDLRSDTVNVSPDNRHCIKISRSKASELDTAEGLISKYIPVIPGNYNFTYSIRLQDIVNNKYRLGVQLYDAIVVKVLFFDEHKQPIAPGYLNPVSGVLIDNSDKGYSFSNFWKIETFPWGKVRGRSYNYPFSEGDIPDQTRFVRLFFGLKGTGTLWLDDIYFGYSKWNFTALERFAPFFEKRLPLAETIIPTPKQFHEVGDITYFTPGSPSSHLPVIVLPENPAPAERSAANVLQKKLGDVLKAAIPSQTDNANPVKILEKDVGFSDLLDAKLILSIGSNQAYRYVQPNLPLQSISDKPQGYIIKSEQVGNTHVVFLMGATPIGSYYAAATALQLFEDKQPVFHDAVVIDYPDFLSRSYVFKHWKDETELRNDLDNVERMSLYKLNKVYLGYRRANRTRFQPDALYRQGLSESGRMLKESGVMSMAVKFNPYAQFPMEAAVESLDDALRYTWIHSSPESLTMLQEVFRMGLEAGADTILLQSDDFVPHAGTNSQNYALYTIEDKERFVNLQNAQAHIINGLKRWLDSDYPGTQLEFCPPWYSNEHIDRSNGKAEIYLKELAFQIPQDVAIIWTGPTIRSLSIDMADLHRYQSLIGRWPMVWDNTLYARNIETKRYGGYTTYYPGKVRMCNLFEPFDNYVPKDFYRFNNRRQRYTNGNAYSDVYKIKFATVADYEWNTAAYNPERSLWKVLYRTYGPALAQALIRFSDTYYQAYGICLKMEMAGTNQKDLDQAKLALVDLNHRITDITPMLSEDQPLLKELVAFRDRQKRRIQKLSASTDMDDSP